MSVVKNALEQIADAANSLKDIMEERKKQLSDVDGALLDLDHELELVGGDAIKLTKIVKLRQLLLRERRDIKNEIEQVVGVTSTIKIIGTNAHMFNSAAKTIVSKISEQNSRTYTYRSSAISELFGRKKIVTAEAQVADS